MPALNHLSIADAARLLASRDISATDLLDAHLAAIEQVDDRLHSFVTLTADQARADAAAATTEIAAGRHRGPLHGIPYGLKDVFETKGIRTTAQSRVLARNVPSRDCHARDSGDGASLTREG